MDRIGRLEIHEARGAHELPGPTEEARRVVDQRLRREAVDGDDARPEQIRRSLARTHDVQAFGEPLEAHRHAAQLLSPGARIDIGVRVVGGGHRFACPEQEGRGVECRGTGAQRRDALLEELSGARGKAAVDARELREVIEVLHARFGRIARRGIGRRGKGRPEAPVQHLLDHALALPGEREDETRPQEDDGEEDAGAVQASGTTAPRNARPSSQAKAALSRPPATM